MAVWNEFAIYFSPTTTFLLCSNWFMSDELKFSWAYSLMQSVKCKGKTTPWHYLNHTFSFIVLLTTPTISPVDAKRPIIIIQNHSTYLLKKEESFIECVKNQ